MAKEDTKTVLNPGRPVRLGRSDPALRLEDRKTYVAEEKRITSLLGAISLDRSTIIPLAHNPVGRAVPEKHADQPLSRRGATTHGGRFNFKPRKGTATDTYYVADGKATALKECTSTLRPTQPFRYLPLIVDLQYAWDLRGTANCKSNGIDRTELLAVNWQYNQDILFLPSYSQKVGALAFADREIEAVCYESTRNPKGFCIAVFVEKLLVGSSVILIDPNGTTAIDRIDGLRPKNITDTEL